MLLNTETATACGLTRTAVKLIGITSIPIVLFGLLAVAVSMVEDAKERLSRAWARLGR